MIIFNKQSWHYRLILYTFGQAFFLDTSEIDWKATEEQSINKENFKIIHKSKPKTVNLCPYCRAVFGSVISLPFVFLYKLLPHKKKKPLSHKEIMHNMRRRTNIIRVVAACVNVAFGIRNVLLDEPVGAAIQFGVAFFVLTGHLWILQLSKVIWKFLLVLKLIRKRKPKTTIPKTKNPSLLLTKLQAEHNKICPPIYFVDKLDNTNLK